MLVVNVVIVVVVFLHFLVIVAVVVVVAVYSGCVYLLYYRAAESLQRDHATLCVLDEYASE